MISLLSKSVLFAKSVCFKLAVKLSGVNALNSGVTIYLPLIDNFLLNFTNFCILYLVSSSQLQ